MRSCEPSEGIFRQPRKFRPPGEQFGKPKCNVPKRLKGAKAYDTGRASIFKKRANIIYFVVYTPLQVLLKLHLNFHRSQESL
mgnify:CR=1 FL=1